MSNRSGLTLMRRAAGAGAMLLACAPVLADVTIGNWEDSADGWIDWGTQAPIDGNPKYAYSTTGATLGNKSLQISQAGWGQNLAIKLQQDYSPALDLRDEFMANSQFSLDFTVPAIATPGWSEIFALAINAQGYGFVNQQPIPTFQYGFPNGNLRTTTVTWDYSALVDGNPNNGEIAPNAGWIELILATNAQDAEHGIFYFDNARLTSPNVKVDFNGGGAGTLHPNQAGFTAWDDLPTSGQNGNPAQFGYPTASATKAIATGTVASGTINATLTSADVGGTQSSPAYVTGATPEDGPKLNARDMSVPGREFDGTGNFTPTKDNLYRDFAIAEAGAATSSNGTNHRMEVKFEGLDPNTPYKVKFYAYDNSNPQGVSVFTDVTAQPLIVMPSGQSIDGNFTPGDGSGGTQYAPDGQYIDGVAAPTFPTGNDDFRAIELYATSDGTGKLVFAQTTIAGLSGQTQVLPVLNGFEINRDNRSWQGGSGTAWGAAGNWAGGVIPNGKGQVANFGNSTNTAISVDSATTVARLNFSGTSMTIGGSATLSLDDNSINSTLSGHVTGRTEINLTASSGNQTIDAPLLMNKDTQVWVSAAGTTLTASNLQPSQVVLTKVGDGTLAVNNVRANALRVFDGAVRVLPDGTAANTSVVRSISVGASARLDLTDNDVIVDYTGASPEFELRDKALLARDGDVEGIFFTGSDDDFSDKVLAFGEALELGFTEFNGVTVDDTAVLGKYTYYGDANFDGQVTTDDYVAVDLGLGTGDSWVQGDFDLNGVVTTDDYVVVDLNLGKGSGDPLAYAQEQAEMIALHTEMFGQSYVEKLAYASEFGWVTASVPEPTSVGVLGIASTLLGARRRRLR